MWLSNVLYGPPALRAYRIDLDTVREIAKTLSQEFPKGVITYQVVDAELGLDREIQAADLDTLSAADLQRLRIDARNARSQNAAYYGPIVNVSLARSGSWVNSSDPNNAEVADRVGTRVRQIIADSGRPMLRRRRVNWRAVVFWLPSALVLASWLWLELTTALPFPAHVLGWLLVLVSVWATIPRYERARDRRGFFAPHPNGHLVLSETRRETAARRADRRRDLRVVIWTALATLVVTLTGTVILFFSLGIGRPSEPSQPHEPAGGAAPALVTDVALGLEAM